MQGNFQQQQQQMQYGGMMGPSQHLQQQQVHPAMMQGMMPQQMYMQQQFPPHMYPPNQMNQDGRAPARQVGPGGMMFRGQGPGGPAGQYMTPPSYTPQMAQNFQAKQEKMMAAQARKLEEEKRRMEQQMRQRQFVEQKKKLQEFSSLGIRKIDPDAYMKSLVGEDKARVNHKHTGPPQQQPPHSQQPTQEQAEDDDGFGEFLSGPTRNGQPTPAAKPPDRSQSTSQSANHQPVVNNQPSNQTQAAHPSHNSQSKPAAKNSPKDLMSMMFECSDLNAPKNAKTFVRKVSVKDVAPKKVQASYAQSQKARQWTDTSQFSDLFLMPDQGNGEGHRPIPKIPKWLSGEVAPPKIYMQVQEAATRDEKIDTEMLYPILLRSSLPREVLGQIWAMANRSKPGELNQQELYMILALISIAQNNLDYSTIDVLLRCPQAPVPNLGQYGAPPVVQQEPQGPPGVPAGSGLPSSQGGVSAGPGVPFGQVAPPGVPHSQVGAGATVGQGIPAVVPQSQGMPLVSPHGQGVPAGPLMSQAGLLHNSSSVSSSAPHVAAGMPGYPGVHQDVGAVYSQGSAVATSAHGHMVPSLIPGASHSQVPQAAPLGVGSVAGVPHTGVPHGSQIGINAPPASQAPDLLVHGYPTSLPVSEGHFHPARFTHPAAVSTEDDDFEDFQAAPTSSSNIPESFIPATTLTSQISLPANQASSHGHVKPPDKPTDLIGPEDKYSALRLSLSTEDEPSATKDADFDDIRSATGSSEFADFHAFDSGVSSGNTTVSKGLSESLPQSSSSAFPGFSEISTPAAVMTSASSDRIAALKALVQDKNLYKDKKKEDPEEAEWADFQAVQPDCTESKKEMKYDLNEPVQTSPGEWASFPGVPTPHTTTSASAGAQTTRTSPARSFTTDASRSSSKPGLGRKKDYFGRTLVPPAVPGTGMSPLDIIPPDLPDTHEDEEFDEFGTFQHNPDTSTEGMSSLGTAMYSVVDDDMFSYNSRPPQHLPVAADGTDTISTSSYEFTGWKNRHKEAKEDSQSVSSLDFQRAKSSSKEDSPVGGDSQSVSSLEFTGDLASRRQDTPGDDRSIASLELRMAYLGADTPGSTGAMEESFGDFNSASDSSQSFANSTVPTDSSEPQQEVKPRTASELLSEGAFPGIVSIGDRYVSLSREPQDREKHTYMWTRCLDKCCEMIQQASMILTSIQQTRLISEIVTSEQGIQYLEGIVEVFRVLCRIKTAMKAYSVSNDELTDVLKETNIAWSNMMECVSDTPLYPKSASLDFSTAILKGEGGEVQEKACGLCLLDVNIKPKGNNYEVHKLTYGGRQYHTTCANFWVNCVDSILPTLTIPELL